MELEFLCGCSQSSMGSSESKHILISLITQITPALKAMGIQEISERLDKKLKEMMSTASSRPKF